VSIFKTEVPEGMCCTTDQVARTNNADRFETEKLPWLGKAAQMDVQNTQRGAVRRMSGDK
jgi:hypothetical protein